MEAFSPLSPPPTPSQKPRVVYALFPNPPNPPPRPAPRRISAPNRLLLPRRFHCRRQPLLSVLHLHHADWPQLPGRDHLSRLPHHRITRVIVGQAKDQPAPPYDLS